MPPLEKQPATIHHPPPKAKQMPVSLVSTSVISALKKRCILQQVIPITHKCVDKHKAGKRAQKRINVNSAYAEERRYKQRKHEQRRLHQQNLPRFPERKPADKRQIQTEHKPLRSHAKRVFTIDRAAKKANEFSAQNTAGAPWQEGRCRTKTAAAPRRPADRDAHHPQHRPSVCEFIVKMKHFSVIHKPHQRKYQHPHAEGRAEETACKSRKFRFE